MNKLITKNLLNDFLQNGEGNGVLEAELSDLLTYNTFLYRSIDVFVGAIDFFRKIVIVSSCEDLSISEDGEFECVPLTFRQFISECLQ